MRAGQSIAAAIVRGWRIQRARQEQIETVSKIKQNMCSHT